MPHDNINHAIITGEESNEPEGYFNYANVNDIKFNNINGIYGNAKGLQKTSTTVSLQLTNTYLFYSKVSSTVFSGNLDTNKKYLFKINNSYGYGQFNGSYLELLSMSINI